MSVGKRLEQTRDRLRSAALDAGRDPVAVRLLAVSKRKPSSDIRAAYEAGQRDFGENYVQELVQKAEELADLPDIRFHHIGHLQRNKARHVVPHAALIHAVDSASLAAELAKRAAAMPKPRPLGILLEVNVGRDPAKHGCAPEQLAELLGAVESHDFLELRGLMTMPPRTESQAEARGYFDQLRELRESHGGEARLPELSMGMSHDLEAAVAAGATWVRIGTAIFGARS